MPPNKACVTVSIPNYLTEVNCLPVVQRSHEPLFSGLRGK